MEIVYVLVGYDAGLDQMDARYWRVLGAAHLVLAERGLLLQMEGDRSPSILWDQIPEDLFETPVWVDGSPSTLGEEMKEFI